MASLTVLDLVVKVGERPNLQTVLRIPRLQIHSGEYVCVVGPNGSGKSMLIQVLAGIRSPSAGEIQCDQEVGNAPGLVPHPGPVQHPGAVHHPGLVLQHPEDQLVGSTVEKDLAFGLECRRENPAIIRQRVQEALAWSGLEEQADRPPHLLSDGEKQLLALASALIHRPRVLLLDEPTSRLDPAARALFLNRFHSYRAETKATVVHVTHRSDEFMEADRIVGLLGGEVAFDGTPEKFLDDQASPRFRVLWSPLHRFRRKLAHLGTPMDVPPSRQWNDPHVLLAQLLIR
jgi:energy-coupling factor transporter ATP-binding protein EcfA2